MHAQILILSCREWLHVAKNVGIIGCCRVAVNCNASESQLEHIRRLFDSESGHFPALICSFLLSSYLSTMQAHPEAGPGRDCPAHSVKGKENKAHEAL